MVSTLTCLDCGYSWTPRKDVTRYSRQYPKCKHTHFNQTGATKNPQGISSTTIAAVNQPIAKGPQWPKIVYDLQGLLGASSPENALARTYELCLRLSPYKHTHGLESLEKVFEFLEKRATDGSRRAAEAEEQYKSILENPELVFYEAGSDLAAVDWYNGWKKSGYSKDFLTFLSETVAEHFENQGFELEFRES